MQTSSDELKQIIRQSPLSLAQIATKAGVKYGPLYRWFSGRTGNFSILDADAVSHALTGKALIHCKGVAA